MENEEDCGDLIILNVYSQKLFYASARIHNLLSSCRKVHEKQQNNPWNQLKPRINTTHERKISHALSSPLFLTLDFLVSTLAPFSL